MEFVFRGGKDAGHDLFIEPNSDGSVSICMRSKSETGMYSFKLSEEEFDLLIKVRELSYRHSSVIKMED